MDTGADESLLRHEPPLLASLAGTRREAGIAAARDDSVTVPEDRLAVLKLVFPPREYTDGEGNRYVVYVRRDALSRGDLSALDRNLEAKLCAKQARDTPVCPVREECFSEAFDELIRQVILECPERGLLLARARDQLRMTLAAYMTVYQDSLAIALDRQARADEGVRRLSEQTEQLEQRKRDLELRAAELRTKHQLMEERYAREQTRLEGEREQEQERLRFQASNLQTFLRNAEPL